MKRTIALLLAALLLLAFPGCAGNQKQQPQNELFTDDFFEDVVEIKDSCCGRLVGEQITPMIRYLKSLSLSPTDIVLSGVNEKGEQLYGLFGLTFVKRDGTEVEFLHNTRTLTNVDEANLGSWVTPEGVNFTLGMQDVFWQVVKEYGGEDTLP